MSVEGRGWVTRVGIDLVNWQQEEPADFDGRRQPSMGDTSRMSREAHVRICERLGQPPGLLCGNAGVQPDQGIAGRNSSREMGRACSFRRALFPGFRPDLKAAPAQG